MPMTADEAVEAIARHEDAAHHLTSEELAPYTAHRQAAEAAIREAFAVLEAIEEELATPHGGGERYPVLNSLLDTARARLEAKPDADDR